MNGRKTLIGISLFCALALSAFGAASASAANGTTAFTCVQKTGGGFIDEHCGEKGSAKVEYGHELITTKETALESSSVEPTIVLHSEQFGIPVTITCKKQAGTGKITNSEPEKGKHTLTGEEIKITYSECDMDILGETCSLVNGEVKVPNVKSMDVENAHGFEMGIKFEPTEALKPFAEFESGADCPVIGKKLFKVEGSALGVPKGATVEFNEASTKPTLTVNGFAAWFTDRDTFKMAGGGNPISVTTTP